MKINEPSEPKEKKRPRAGARPYSVPGINEGWNKPPVIRECEYEKKDTLPHNSTESRPEKSG